MALIPLFFIAVVITNFFFLILWAVISRKYMLISGVALLLSMGEISAVYPVKSIFNKSNPDNADFSVMQYNVMLFGFYDWSNNKQIKANILNLIFEHPPDILCLQEVYWRDNYDDFNPLKRIMNEFEGYQIHKEAMAEARLGQNFGLATISRYPIVNTGIIEFENSFNGAIYSDIIIKADTLRIFNCHMQSIQLEQKDYTVIETLADSVDNTKLRILLRKIMQASQKRAAQADIVAEEIKMSPYPVLVSGDLNDFPLSYTYLIISAGLKDTYVYQGKFPGYTWDNFGIKQRIDYIFYDNKLKCTSHKVIKKKLSDHYPVVAHFLLN